MRSTRGNGVLGDIHVRLLGVRYPEFIANGDALRVSMADFAKRHYQQINVFVRYLGAEQKSSESETLPRHDPREFTHAMNIARGILSLARSSSTRISPRPWMRSLPVSWLP